MLEKSSVKKETYITEIENKLEELYNKKKNLEKEKIDEITDKNNLIENYKTT
jgi:hypothetical protein